MEKTLAIYIVFGAVIGFFFGGIWEAIAAMVLIYIALRMDHFIKKKEDRR
ncbi:DUF3329 domain-containing protein [Planococcus versutus]|nr:DUF3329 domain-containing protein [Planococcus versutus]